MLVGCGAVCWQRGSWRSGIHPHSGCCAKLAEHHEAALCCVPSAVGCLLVGPKPWMMLPAYVLPAVMWAATAAAVLLTCPCTS